MYKNFDVVVLITCFWRRENSITFVSMKTFVIVGCGRLAGIVSEAVVKGLLPEYELVGVYSRTVAKAERIAGEMEKIGKSCAVCTTVDGLLALKPDILVETASPAALREFAIPALKNGTSIVTLSIGALADDSFYREVCEMAKENGTRVYIASGATGGFDVLRTAALMGNATACFFNEKGPDALKGTPVYEETMQSEQKVVFTGNAVEAIRLFPTKVNVTVAASRASVGPEAMQVTIQSTPGFKGDTQKVEIRNDQVHAVVDVYSATAEIAGWSVVNTLLNIVSPVVF